MIRHLEQLAQRFSRKGFTGPYYRGFTGKIRFALESLLFRRERFFVLHKDAFLAVQPPVISGFEVVRIADPEQLEAFRAGLEAAWYPGLLESWRGPWSWGERLYLGLLNGVPVSYNWLQRGTAAGHPTYWGRFYEGEYRILRGAVAPSWRGQGGNTAMKHAIFSTLFAHDATRVYAECYARNIPSVRTLRSLGFKEVGQLTVLEIPGFKGFIRWTAAMTE
jgi:ribosomal protein S18 acetylase RimI-like enzyme